MDDAILGGVFGLDSVRRRKSRNDPNTVVLAKLEAIHAYRIAGALPYR
jgi:hypothetical protein